MSSSLKRLGLPKEWEGINGAVNYLRVLNKDKDNKKKLELMVKHVIQVLLYLNYVSLLKKGEPNMVTRILNDYHNDPNKAKTKAARQKNFHTYYIYLERWWWRLAARLGLGILLVTNNLVMNM